MTLANRVRMSVASAPGTGTITLGNAFAGYQTFDAAGVADQAVVSYVIEDGAAWEVGRGIYTQSGTQLSRTTIFQSSNSGSAINASSGAQVFIAPLAADFPSYGKIFFAAGGA